MFNVKTLEELHSLTWNELVELEPRLDDLLAKVRAAKPADPYNEYYNWEGDWGEFKPLITKLVGWFRRDDPDSILRSTEAYQIVYHTLLHEFLSEGEK